MRLATFIELERAEIITDAVAFAKSIPILRNTSVDTLRDHLPLVLDAISADLRTEQSRTESMEKSHGNAPIALEETSAQSHGTHRAQSGIDIEHLVAEYRALRSSILRLWSEGHRAGPEAIRDIMRFNEAIDQSVAESVQCFARERERWRDIFLGVLGHDLRGPLNAIALTAELMSQQGIAPEGQTALLTRGAARMKALLDSLLEYNRSNLGVGMVLHLATTDLGAACTEEIELQRAAHPGATIEYSSEGDTTGQFDASRVREALGNLIANAIKHGGQGEAVKVAVTGTPKLVQVTVENQGDLLPEGIEALFEPLRRGGARAAPERTHLGLGLFITRQIARAHGGEVMGTCSNQRVRFTVELPRV